MSAERFLVTGALGCIGAWTVRTLVREGVEVAGYDLGGSRHRLELVLAPEELERVELVAGDIADLGALAQALDEREITNVIHLAALQVPFCRADPPLGALVNVVGTVNVFEAVKGRRERIRNVVLASSAAVYGADGSLVPATHYGVYKAANEGSARIYWQDDGVPSVALRPYIVYGPGRDQGVTAEPTLAMAAAARGEPYRIGFGGSYHFQHAEDVARTLIAASRAELEGAHVFDLPGGPVHVREIVAAIRAAVPDAEIDCEGGQLPFPETLPGPTPERLLGALPATPLADGVRATIEHFQSRA